MWPINFFDGNFSYGPSAMMRWFIIQVIIDGERVGILQEE